MDKQLKSYINEKVDMLRSDFHINLTASESINLWASKTEVEVDNKMRKIFNAHL